MLLDEDRKQRGEVGQGEMAVLKCLKMLSGQSCTWRGKQVMMGKEWKHMEKTSENES